MKLSSHYRPPPINRGFDPQRVNWLWRLIAKTANLDPTYVHQALVAQGVSIDLPRVISWFAEEGDDHFMPMTIAELERNLRVLITMQVLPP